MSVLTSVSSASPSATPIVAAPAVTPGPLPTRYRTLTFSAGFLCGQASLIFVAVLFLRYVVFEDPKVALREAGKRKNKRLRSSASKRQRARPSSSSAQQQLFSATASIPASDSLLLQKVGYDLSSHSPESLDWLNVLLAQAVSAYRGMIIHAAEEKDGRDHDAEREEGEIQARGAKGFVEDALNQGRSEGEGMITLDYVQVVLSWSYGYLGLLFYFVSSTVTEFEFGQEYPILSNARVRPSNESGKVRIEVDVDYSDHVSLGIETKVLLNFPKPKFGIIPVSLALALVRFSATLTLEIPPPFGTSTSSTSTSSSAFSGATMSASIHPDFILELASTSLIGSRAKLQDIPKVEQLIIGRIRGWVIENLVWPRVRTFKLPSVNRQRAEEEAGLAVQGEQQDEDDLLDLRSATESQVDEDDDDGRSGTSTREDGIPRRRASSSSSATVPLDAVGRGPAIRLHTSSTHNLRETAAAQPGRQGGYATGVDSLDAGLQGTTGMHHRARRRSSLSSSMSVSSTSAVASPQDPASASTSSNVSRQASAQGRHGLSSSVSLASSTSGRERSESFARYKTPLHSPGLGLSFRPGASVSGSITTAPSSVNKASSVRSQPITPTHPLSRTSSSLSVSSLDSGTTTSAAVFDIGTPRWEQARKVYAERAAAASGKHQSRRNSAQSSASSGAGGGYFEVHSPPFLSRRTSRVVEDPDGEIEEAATGDREPDDSQFEIEELADL